MVPGDPVGSLNTFLTPHRTSSISSQSKQHKERVSDKIPSNIKQGKEGVVIVKTTQAILISHYPETVQPGAAANTVEQLADYLLSVGY